MNTNAPARHYDALTPRERLPLILATSLHDDQTEFNRLTRSAPRIGYGVPDYYGLSEGILTVTNSYMLQQLDLAATYWRLMAMAADQGDQDQRL